MRCVMSFSSEWRRVVDPGALRCGNANVKLVANVSIRHSRPCQRHTPSCCATPCSDGYVLSKSGASRYSS